MIKNFTVKAFKSLESVSIELGRVNVFIGANGSGKSNLLEAIGILGAAASGRVDDAAFLRRGVRPGLPALYKSSFKVQKAKQPPEIRFEARTTDGTSYGVSMFNPLRMPEPAWRFKSEKLASPNGSVIVGRGPNSVLRLDSTSGFAALKAIEFPSESSESELIDNLRDYAIFSPDTTILRGLETDNQMRVPVGLRGGGLAEAVRDVFHPKLGQVCKSRRWKLLYEEVVELIGWAASFGGASASSVPVSRTVAQPTMILRFYDRYMAEKRNTLSGYDASEGALYILLMTVLAHHNQAPRILSVDNFDHALNPRLARALTRKLCEWVCARKDRQMLLTSHNPLVLDGLPLLDDEVRLFTVERSRTGRTVVTRVHVSEDVIKAAEEGMPLSQQWIMGTFGGVPNI